MVRECQTLNPCSHAPHQKFHETSHDQTLALSKHSTAMSAEEGSAQPPTAGNDKAQAPKPAATFSSFINSESLQVSFTHFADS